MGVLLDIFFFFQAEDGIRYRTVTGVQTCALPISDDHVAVRWRTGRRVHRGAYRGIPPTGREVELTGMQLARLEGERMAETWLELDELAAVRAMGLVPPEGIAAPRLAAFVLGSAFRFA